MTTELIILGISLMCACALFVALFLRAFYFERFKKALVFKGIASICFVCLGALTCFTGNISRTSLLVFIGLCFGIVGDEVIALCQVCPKYDTPAFVGGGTVFLVGHVFYIVALLSFGKISWISIAMFFAVAVIVSFVYERKRRFLRGEMKLPLALYLGIVTFVGALAVGLLNARVTVGAGMFAVGGLLFATSDNILFAYKLGEKPRFIQNVALHVTYYLAQLLIAWSIAWI